MSGQTKTIRLDVLSSEPWRNLSQLLQIYSCSRFIAAKPQGSQALRARRKVLCSCHLCRGAREIPPSQELQGILGSHVAVILFYDGEGIQSSGRNRQASPGTSDFVAAMSERHRAARFCCERSTSDPSCAGVWHSLSCSQRASRC